MKVDKIYLCMQCGEVMEFPPNRCPECNSTLVVPVCGWVTAFSVTHKKALEAAMMTTMASQDRGRTSSGGTSPQLEGADLIVDMEKAVGC